LRYSQAEFRIAEPTGRERAAWTETCPLDDVPGEWHPHWDRLAARAAEPNAFAERWFVTTGARHLLRERGAGLIGAWTEEEGERALLGLLPLRIERRYGRSPIRHVENWLHHHSFLGTPLVRAGRETAFWTAVLDALDRAPWADGFFHINGLVEGGPVHRGLVEAARRLGRPCDTVHRSERALLASDLSPSAYYESTLRKKKRKELKRLSARLAELGALAFSTLRPGDDAGRWCDDFLALEASGWKGRRGSALASHPATEAFFRETFRAAAGAGRLDALRLTCGGRPIAMLINLLAPPGAFSFKTAIDEDYARFSPGVLIQIENLRLLERGDVAWTDSCAVEDHPMINSLWRQRRSIVRATVPLSGCRRRAAFAAARMLENGSALLRRLTTRTGAKA
jgi:CelD/BcsL family acetyltransferase involved in cellulose biosynthesis